MKSKPKTARKPRKLFSVIYPGGPSGVFYRKPKERKQDKRARPFEAFAVVFFPRITGIGKAEVGFYGIERSMANSPEVAKARFMDGIAKGETWVTYHRAGHRVRRIKVVDLGDAN